MYFIPLPNREILMVRTQKNVHIKGILDIPHSIDMMIFNYVKLISKENQEKRTD